MRPEKRSAKGVRDPVRISRAQLDAMLRDAWPGTSASVRTSLVDEHVGSACEPDAPEFTVREVDGRAVFLAREGRCVWVYGTLHRSAVDGHAAAGWPERGDAETIWTGGPPGGYLRGGLAADGLDPAGWFARQGFVERARHVDLFVTARPPGRTEPRVRRARVEELGPLAEWVRTEFSAGWAREVRRALVHHEAVFVHGDSGAYVGVAAHSGNNAALGTFGPIGVVAGARGHGLGRTLARAALDDLFVRGFRRVIIPWVDPALETFYRALVGRVTVERRVLLARG